MLLAVLFVVAQACVAVTQWEQPHGFFQYRMFSGSPSIVEVEVADQTPVPRRLDTRSTSVPRGEIAPETYARAVCNHHHTAAEVTVRLSTGDVVVRRC
jgi:hypothetical protein